MNLKRTDLIKNPDMPKFAWVGDSVTLTGRAMPEFAEDAWSAFIMDLKDYYSEFKETISPRNKFIINLKLDFYNSASSIFITTIFQLMQSNKNKCQSIVNWHYFAADDDDLANAEMYKESRNFKSVKVNLIERND
jgi:hypothetical protein